MSPRALPGQTGDDEPRGGAATRLLIADDDDDFRLAAAELLRLEGFDVIELDDGQAAFDHALAHDDIDVVLLDHRMPGITGGDVYERLRRLRPQLPVVVMTAAMDPERLARELGAPSVLNKPFDVDELLAAIEAVRAARRP